MLVSPISLGRERRGRMGLYMANRDLLRDWDRLSIEMPSYQYRDSHVKDKMVSRPSYL